MTTKRSNGVAVPILGLRPAAERLIPVLFGIEDDPLARLTVAQQLGCRVLATVTRPAEDNGMCWLQSAWLDSEGGISFRADSGKACGTRCYDFRLTAGAVSVSSATMATELFGPVERERLFVAREVAAQHLQDLAQADPSTDALSPYGFGMGSVRTRFSGHDLPPPVAAVFAGLAA